MTAPNRKIDDAQRNKYLRWGVIMMLVILVPVYVVLLRSWLIDLSWGIWVIADSLLIIAAVVAVYLFFDRSLRWKEEREMLAQELAQAEKRADDAYQLQQSIFQISQMYDQASDEIEVIQLTLSLSREVVGVQGASFVPLDDRAQPLTPLVEGDIPTQLSQDWLQYLASPAVRQRCSTCRNLGHVTSDCSLLEAPIAGAVGMFCLPFIRGDQEFGMLNLYMPETEHISPDKQDLLKKIVDEATLALEGIRLHKRELATLHELQSARERTDLDSLITGLLLNLNDTLEADYSQLSVWNGKPKDRPLEVQVGELPNSARLLIDGIIQTVMTSKLPVLIGDVSGSVSAAPGLRALMAAPLICSDGSVMGALVVTSRQVKAFNQRQLSMLQTVSGQTAMVIQNINLIAELEYKTMMEERMRLAREIHDGLAQTLGFLKLKLAQMKNYAEQADYGRLVETIPICYNTLTDAYQEVRQSIDGLRIKTGSVGMEGWLRQAAIEFQENTGLSVHLSEPVGDPSLPPEVHAQLIRIVQEALNNVRKHADSGEAWVSCQEIDGDLILEVRDDGSGFDIDDIPGPSRHGLQGMRERAELIGADFQVISRARQGTIVRVRLPLSFIREKM
jgi:two-component system nitrate/nitrite sensor histidine kinase NarX